jgi:3-mercaptopyruvate sulfurtransferase SseA
VAQQLLDRGWTGVRAMLGGLDAWRQAGYPVQPKGGSAATDNLKLSASEVQENLRKAEGDQDQV